LTQAVTGLLFGVEWTGLADFDYTTLSERSANSACFMLSIMENVPNIIPAKVTDSEKLKALAEELVMYREGVERYLRLKSSTQIPNGQPAHAAILFEIFFKYARDHVRIFCHKLSQRVYNSDSLVDAAKWALDRGRKISVLYQDSEPEDGELLAELRKSKMVVARAPEEVRDWNINFAVMDDYAYRIETDRSQCKAIAVMNDPVTAKNYARKFDILALQTKLGETIKQAEDLTNTVAAV
jgi:hypothetical protein